MARSVTDRYGHDDPPVTKDVPFAVEQSSRSLDVHIGSHVLVPRHVGHGRLPLGALDD